jgi:hypothetical protein
VQVWAAPLGVDAHGAQLQCDFKSQGKKDFQDAVGAIAMRVCQVLRDAYCLWRVGHSFTVSVRANLDAFTSGGRCS